MPPQTKIVKISSVTLQSESGFVAETEEHLQLIVANCTPEPVAIRILRRAVAESRQVAIVFDPHSKLVVIVYWPTIDIIWNVSKAANDSTKLVVALKMRPTLIHLSIKNPQYEYLAKALEEAKVLKHSMLIAVNPVTSEIEALQMAEEKITSK